MKSLLGFLGTYHLRDQGEAMPNPQHCLAMAEEADRLASIVSYERDKVRLKEQAESWRERAEALASVPSQHLSIAQDKRTGVMGWLRRRRR